jgi:hypothetical protein
MPPLYPLLPLPVNSVTTLGLRAALSTGLLQQA